jgi:hypothetical protein
VAPKKKKTWPTPKKRRGKRKDALKPAPGPVAVLYDDEGNLVPLPKHPAEERVLELTRSLERVNGTLTQRNVELAAAKAVAEREVFKDVVVMAALLDAKGYIAARGGIDAALIIQRISNVEQRLGSQALNAAVTLQKVKALVEARQAGREIFPEDYIELLTSGEKLL